MILSWKIWGEENPIIKYLEIIFKSTWKFSEEKYKISLRDIKDWNILKGMSCGRDGNTKLYITSVLHKLIYRLDANLKSQGHRFI